MTTSVSARRRCRAACCAAAIVLLLASCKHETTEPETVKATGTTPVLLSVGSPGKDEDPSVLRASDGRLFVAWFSERNSNPDIYVSSTTDKVTWSPATRVSTGPNGDFYPNLIQDAAGKFHLVWFQWVALYVGQIRHASSTDGVTWSAEEAVTTNLLVDDWVPTVAEAPNGTLLVYFVSYKRDLTNPTNQLYVAAKRPGQSTWDPAVVVAGINSVTEHDQLPFVARTGNQLSLVWVRYDVSNADFITNPRSDLYLATSSDGLTWSVPLRVTKDGVGQNLFPQFYQRHDGSWNLLWLSTRSGTPALYEIPLAGVSAYPTGVVVNTLLPAGYSHRITRASTPNEYLAAWVQGATGVQDIYTRFITTH